MKKIIIYIVIIGLIACKETDSNFVSLIVLSDKTDEHIPRPELADIQYFFHQSDFINAGKRFYFREITHTSVNKLYTAEYFQSSLLDNKLSEKKDKTDFEARIENILRKNHNEKQKYENSTIIKPLIQCLELLKAERSTRKIIILYSDLLEANELFNTYNFKNSQQLLKNPREVASHFTSTLVIPKLKGIELYLVYQPKEIYDNQLFEKMVEVYQIIFKDSGLQIRIGIPNAIK